MNTFLLQCKDSRPDAQHSHPSKAAGAWKILHLGTFLLLNYFLPLQIFSDPVLFRCRPSQDSWHTTRAIDFLGHREERGVRLLYPGGKRFTVWKFIFLFILSPTPAHPFGWQLFCQVQYFIITRASNLFRSLLFFHTYTCSSRK
jgi:hypothetical protein